MRQRKGLSLLVCQWNVFTLHSPQYHTRRLQVNPPLSSLILDTCVATPRLVTQMILGHDTFRGTRTTIDVYSETISFKSHPGLLVKLIPSLPGATMIEDTRDHISEFQAEHPAVVCNRIWAEKKNGKETVDFETAIALTGQGRFHYRLMFGCGFCLVAMVCELYGTSYLLPAAQCDFQMSAQEKGLLNSISLIGVISSSHLWGYLADTKGRRKILMVTLAMDAVCAVISCFAPTFYIYLVVRYFCGFFVCGPSAIVYAYIGEFHAAPTRARAIVFVSVVVSIASIGQPASATVAFAPCGQRKGILPFQLSAISSSLSLSLSLSRGCGDLFRHFLSERLLCYLDNGIVRRKEVGVVMSGVRVNTFVCKLVYKSHAEKSVISERACEILQIESIGGNVGLKLGSSSLVAGLAWLVIPQPWSFQLAWFTFNSWRVFVFLCAVPSILTCLFLFFFLPESPKYYLVKGREEEALTILGWMYSLNNNTSPEDYPIKSIKMELPPEELERLKALSESPTLLTVVKSVWYQTAPLFCRPHLGATLLVCFTQFGLFT
ncbi:unnamed protein product, partial [Timema podura]|nr:unnamed protein product [Timema podura]